MRFRGTAFPKKRNRSANKFARAPADRAWNMALTPPSGGQVPRLVCVCLHPVSNAESPLIIELYISFS